MNNKYNKCNKYTKCIRVCCSVLQCVASVCSVLQCVAVCCSVLECVGVCWSVLQCFSVCININAINTLNAFDSICTTYKCKYKYKMYMNIYIGERAAASRRDVVGAAGIIPIQQRPFCLSWSVYICIYLYVYI